jgi:hypothetical protein
VRITRKRRDGYDRRPAARRRSGDVSELPITGLLFLVGIFINSYQYGLTALLGLVVATHRLSPGCGSSAQFK